MLLKSALPSQESQLTYSSKPFDCTLLKSALPSQESQLDSRMKKLLYRVGFPVANIYLLNGVSKRNACLVHGVPPLILLTDSILVKDRNGNSSVMAEGLNQEEVLAVLGHELGHWIMVHVPKKMLIQLVRKMHPETSITSNFQRLSKLLNTDAYTIYFLQPLIVLSSIARLRLLEFETLTDSPCSSVKQ